MRFSSSGVIHSFSKWSILSSTLKSIYLRHTSEFHCASFQVDLLKRHFLSDQTLRDLCFSGRLSKAVALLCHTASQLHSKTYSLLLQECIFRKDYMGGKSIHAHMIKEPGYSRIEIQRESHFFYKGDTSHIQMEDIYIIKDLTPILKVAGYIPELGGKISDDS